MISVGIIQESFSGGLEQNTMKLVSEISSGKADLVVAPELALTGYEDGLKAVYSENDITRAVNLISEACSNKGVSTVFGFPMYGGGQHRGAVFNGAMVIGPNGSVAKTHRKTVLYGPREQHAFRLGDRPTSVNILGRETSILICYEIEWESVVSESVNENTDLVICISCNMKPMCLDHDSALEYIQREYDADILYVNAAGDDGDTEFCGGSRVVRADGDIVGKLGREEGRAVISL